MSRLQFKEVFYSPDSESESDGEPEKLPPQNVALSSNESIEDSRSSPLEERKQTSLLQSGWLSRFLTMKREISVPEPPEIIPSGDGFLVQFNRNFDGVEPMQRFADVDMESGGTTTGLSDAIVSEDISSTEVDPSAAVDEGTLLKFFNLPYQITEDQVLEFGREHHCKFLRVALDFDKIKNLPAGSATVTLDVASSEEVAKTIEILNGLSCGGRPVRVQRFVSNHGNSRKRKSGDKRYFLGDEMIGFKCLNCGQVGHMQFECTNSPLPAPCHLCAGVDHDASSCPNITCFRCGQFGHHSRDCMNQRSSKPVVCTLCASTSHDSRACNQLWQFSDTSRYTALSNHRLISPDIRCMTCNKTGHTLCRPAKPVKRNIIYCPNCGEEGHHVDFVRPGEQNSCPAPRFDAYNRFPQLTKYLEDKREGGYHGEDRSSLYQTLVRSQSNYEMTLQMFPCLLPPVPIRGSVGSVSGGRNVTVFQRSDRGSSPARSGRSRDERSDNGCSFDRQQGRYPDNRANGSRKDGFESVDRWRDEHSFRRSGYDNYNSNNDYDGYDGSGKRKTFEDRQERPPLKQPRGADYHYTPDEYSDSRHHYHHHHHHESSKNQREYQRQEDRRQRNVDPEPVASHHLDHRNFDEKRPRALSQETIEKLERRQNRFGSR